MLRGHRTLITQSYWREDLGGRAASRDFVDRSASDCRYVAFAMQAGGAVGAFDVVLARA
jgi:hypothetical protein